MGFKQYQDYKTAGQRVCSVSILSPLTYFSNYLIYFETLKAIAIKELTV